MTVAEVLAALSETCPLLWAGIVRAAAGLEVGFHLKVPGRPVATHRGCLQGRVIGGWLRELPAEPRTPTEEIGDGIGDTVDVFHAASCQIQGVQMLLHQETLVLGATGLFHNGGVSIDCKVLAQDEVSYLLQRAFHAE